jgi:ABC-2 type transport system permease protein
VAVVAGTGGWLPLAAPALWALEPGSVSVGQLALVALIPIGFGLLTLAAWRGLQLDK